MRVNLPRSVRFLPRHTRTLTSSRARIHVSGGSSASSRSLSSGRGWPADIVPTPSAFHFFESAFAGKQALANLKSLACAHIRAFSTIGLKRIMPRCLPDVGLHCLPTCLNTPPTSPSLCCKICWRLSSPQPENHPNF